MTVHALSIDLEDWHQILHRRITGASIPPSRHVVTATQRLLDVLDEAGVRATFFVVGMVAEALPALVREVHARGHEIGSHSYLHRTIQSVTRAQLAEDLSRSIRQLEDLTGSPVRGFRAPEFSVRLGHWCFDAIAEAGFAYDSSVFPVHGARYGIPDAPSVPFPIDTPSGRLWEFPLATYRVARRRYPIAGGTYYRLLPYRVLRRAFRQMQTEGQPNVLYFHPYEFHTGWLHLSAQHFRDVLAKDHVKYALLHNFRTGSILRCLARLLREWRFAPLGELYSSVAAKGSDS